MKIDMPPMLKPGDDPGNISALRDYLVRINFQLNSALEEINSQIQRKDADKK